MGRSVQATAGSPRSSTADSCSSDAPTTAPGACRGDASSSASRSRRARAREFEEETGHAVELTGLLGVYSAPDDQIHRYPDGEVVHFVGVVFEGQAGPRARELAGDTTEARWFPTAELPANLMASDVPPIRDALSRRDRPVID